jgi:general stress protein 26
MENKEKFEKVGGLIKDLRTCMFVTTMLNGGLRARPMGTQHTEFTGTVWFMTDKDSNKIKEIAKNKTVGLEYASGNGVTFVSISGEASVVDYKAKIKELWNPFLKAWFEGPEDPKIALIEVKVHRAEYWNNKGGKIGGLADIAITAVTGKANTLDENEVYEF